ncbi:hypothetical protein [Ferruginibacter yonginensis]|uniref:hypothetical protein n=1 Tax=Ferruginibacter yonginensis TaxID=1310416 RepID=UPI0036D40122
MRNRIIAKFEIAITTNESIDSFYILPDNFKNNFIKVESISKVFYDINMTDLHKVNGNYLLSFKSVTKTVFVSFGYYTNGYPMEIITSIFINSDTVQIKPEYKESY